MSDLLNILNDKPLSDLDRKAAANAVIIQCQPTGPPFTFLVVFDFHFDRLPVCCNFFCGTKKMFLQCLQLVRKCPFLGFLGIRSLLVAQLVLVNY